VIRVDVKIDGNLKSHVFVMPEFPCDFAILLIAKNPRNLQFFA